MIRSNLFRRFSFSHRKRFLARAFSSVSNHGANEVVTLGIMRETYNAWERRVPLTPNRVKDLISSKKTLKKDVRVVMQPCKKRIYGAKSFEEAGAISQEDLHDADIILSVKRPADVSCLLPNKTYMFFSHTVKGQPENMDLLRECLTKKIQLIDYERIVRPDGKRLVSFGRFAGLAGAIDTLHGLGRRLHQEGQWTPFNVFPQTIYKDDLEDAKKNVDELAKSIASEGTSTDGPLIFAVTGKGGAVHGGAMEILECLPHEIVSVGDLPQLVSSQDASLHKKIYIVQLGLSDVFQREDGSFDRCDFGKNPDLYHSTFSQKVAPYITVTLNCAYWDDRFPRILTKEETKELFLSGKSRFLLLADLSCDVNGSFEFLEKTTCIEKPFFNYNPVTETVSDEVSSDGITVLGVDILPTQLPKESSEHFGNKLLPVVEELVGCLGADGGVQVSELSDGVRGACITTTTGALESNYRFLDQFLDRAGPCSKDHAQHTMILSLWGHLFDTGLINEILDAIVDRGKCSLKIENAAFPSLGGQKVMSSITLRVSTEQSPEVLDLVEKDIRKQIEAFKDAKAKMDRKDIKMNKKQSGGITENPEIKAEVKDMDPSRVLVLGSGFVAKTTVAYLDIHTNSFIQIASNKDDEARDVALVAKNSSSTHIDTKNDPRKLRELVKQADVVLSLVPADLHAFVAEACLAHDKNMVTCSYVSKEMMALDDAAKAKGLVFLNEQGLDPGLDHMSAMQIIDDIKDRGGKIKRFSSVCGGLPSPQAIDETNPLCYKFSWSPVGVLKASRQDACYRQNKHRIEVPGANLLEAATPFAKAWPEFNLEVLPNRNALVYESIYGLEEADTIFRGTLRYHGYSELMNVFSNMGMMSSNSVNGDTWDNVMEWLANKKGCTDQWEFLLACSQGNADLAKKTLAFLNHLEMVGSNSPGTGCSLEAAFAHVLARKLAYGPDEYDLVLMHHDIGAEFEDGTLENHSSTLKLFGDEHSSAMAKTVGFTAGAAVSLVLDGGLKDRSGIILPTEKMVYEPILSMVQNVGISFTHTNDNLPPQEDNDALYV